MSMTRGLLVASAVSLLAGVALADWPARPRAQGFSSCAREVVEYLAYVPVPIQARIADAGYPMTVTPGNPYKKLRGRGWACSYPDGGVVHIPPKLARMAEHFRPDLLTVVSSTCTDPTLCPSGTDDGTDDGQDNTDPLSEVTLDCACSNGNVLADGGATCRLSPSLANAPVGVTLQPGTFTGPGCKPKACGELWMVNPDTGQRVDSFPASCPLQ